MARQKICVIGRHEAPQQSSGPSSAPIVGEGHRPSRDVTPYTEVRWFHDITGGSMPRPYNGAAEMLCFLPCTDFLLYSICRRSSSVSPSGCHLLPGRRYASEGYFSPPASLPLSSPLVRGGHGCGNPGSFSIPIVGEGQCPSRDVTPYTEVRWFRGITGGSMPRPYKGAAETVWFPLWTDFLPYPTCRRSSSVSPSGCHLLPGRRYAPEGYFSPPASLPAQPPLHKGAFTQLTEPFTR